MKDKFGTFRGKCQPGCACIEFKASPDGTSVRCSECNHAPIRHESFGIVGTCRGCTECQVFEASYGEFQYCEYCECSLQMHCIVQPKPVMPAPVVVPASVGDSQKDVTNQQQQQSPPIGAASTQSQMGATAQELPSNMNVFSPTSTAHVQMNSFGQPPNQMVGQLPNQMVPGQMNQMGQAPMETGQPSVYPMGQVPMNQMGGAQFNPMLPNGGMNMNQNQMYPMGGDPMFQQQYMPPQPQMMMQAANPMKCAIQECNQPPFFDPITGPQPCCSITHAMEHERRRALGSNMVKGITHCLLPNCNKHVWPFMNYCGRTHADAGRNLGLIPPDPNAGTPSQREVSEGVCALPGCNKPRSCCPHALLPGDHIFKNIQSLYKASKGYLEDHGIYLGEVWMFGKMISNAIAFYSGQGSNPVSIKPFESFMNGSSFSVVKYPPKVSKPACEVVKSCLNYAKGYLNIPNQTFTGANFSEDFANLCKFGYAISNLMYKLYGNLQNGNQVLVKNNLFLISYTFYKYVISSGQLHVCLDKIANKVNDYTKSVLGPDFSEMLGYFVKQMKQMPAITHSAST